MKQQKHNQSLLDQALGQSVFHHLFLPHRLPTAADQDHLLQFNHQNEYQLLEYLLPFFAPFDNIPSLPILVDLKKCFQRWLEIQNPQHVSSANFRISLQRLVVGDFLPLYLHAQNAAILVEVDEQGTSQPLISAWQVALPIEVITSSIQPHISCFPAPTFRLSNVVQLHAPVQCELLVDLFNHPVSYSKSSKSSYRFDETRDVAISKYVCQWWLMMLEGTKVTRMGYEFQKKHRDHIRWQDAPIPFRRSGLWMTIKVVCQSILTKRLGPIGKTVYKVFITALLTYAVCREPLSLDLLIYAIRKIARRLDKIDQLCPSLFSVDPVINWIEYMRGDIRSKIEQILPPENMDRSVPMPKFLGLHAHLLHQKKTFRHLCVTLKKNMDQPILPTSREQFSIEQVIQGLTPIHSQATDYVPSMHVLRNEYHYSTDIVLTRVEIWIEQSLEEWIKPVRKERFTVLFDLYRSYQDCALKQKDPICYSRFVLTTLTLLRVMHETLCQEQQFSGLKDHCIRIPHLFELLEFLVLPYRDEMVRARQLYDYFAEYQGKAFPDLLDTTDLTCAFGVRFANHSTSIKATLRQIRNEAERDRQMKETEVNAAKQRYHDMTTRAHALTCECFTFNYHRKCERCSLISTAESISVSIYECPIPVAEHEALAVVFELQMPTEIRVYRDILWQFINRPQPDALNNHMYHWLKVSPHAEKLKPFYQSSIDAKVQLVSDQKSISQSHYSAPLKVMNTAVEQFLFENSLHVQLSPNRSLSLAKECELLTPPLSTGDYQHLQYTLESTEFVQNRVIADLSKCPKNLKRSEHIEFGSFRSGHCLQWWNLLAVLEQESLFLGDDNVILLIQHALWQYGPIKIDKSKLVRTFCPPSHQILRDTAFVDECLLRVTRHLTDCEHNWQNERVLLLLVVITMRIMTICSSTCKEPLVSVIHRCRQIGQKWINLIDRSIQTIQGNDLKESLNLREKISNIALSCLLTYAVHPNRLHWVLTTEEDLLNLHRAITTIGDTRLLTLQNIESNSIIQSYMRVGQHLLIRIQPAIHRLLAQTSFCTLDRFTSEHWSLVQRKDVFQARWKKRWEDRHDGWYDGEHDGTVISIDMTNGAFLINGKPVNFLPETITSHPLFRRVFSDQIFEVQTSDVGQTYVTKHHYHQGRVQYRFHVDGQATNTITIEEYHVKTGDLFRLVPPECFQSELPARLVSDFSHWRKMQTPKIYFRAIHFRQKNFLDESFYMLNIECDLLTKTGSDGQETLLNHSSTLFQDLFQSYFTLLDDREHVEMFFNGDARVHIDLPRLGLAFICNTRENLIQSREYVDMYVDHNQDRGTLLDLQSGLLLSPLSSRNQLGEYHKYRKLLVPYGELYIHQASNSKCVTIKRGAFVQEYFVFLLNDRLRILQPHDTPKGALYLALLHATTTHSSVDPYTGITGMERAFQLLNSAACWSDQPYDDVSLHILRQIASITPKVHYYPEHLTVMECVQWRVNGLSACLQHFGYYLIAKRLIEISFKLDFLHPSSSVPEEISKFFFSKSYNEPLLRKLYWDYRDTFNPIARLSEEMEAEIRLTASSQIHKPEWTILFDQTTPGPYRLTTGLYASGCVKLLESTELQFFPLCKWLKDEYELKNVFIGLLKKADQIRHKASLRDHFELLLDFLRYLNNDSAIHRFYLHILKAVVRGTMPPLPSIPYPPFIRYDTIEHREVHKDRVRFPRKMNATNRDIALQEVTECFERNIPYENRKFPERGVDKYTINQQLKSWRNNQILRTFVEAIDQWFSSVSMAPWNIHRSFDPQKFQVESFENHHTIRPKRSAVELNRSLVKLAEQKYLQQQSKYLPQYKLRSRVTERRTPFPTNLFANPNETTNVYQAISNHFQEQLSDSWQKFQVTEESQYAYPSTDQIRQSLATLVRQAEQCWQALVQSLLASNELLYRIGHLPRLVPVLLITQLFAGRTEVLNAEQMILLGGIIVYWVEEQRLKRALYFALQKMEEDFYKEIVNVPHANWIPSKHLSWLLLELEMNITIREIQVKVAQQMIDPMSDDHSTSLGSIVMQLNMGEGKTSVILPMLALQLSSPTSLVRLILLKSLLPTNYQSLRDKLSGLLNRRVLIFHCHRQMNFSIKELQIISARFKQALIEHDIVLSSPEDILSFDLLTIDRCRREEFDIGQVMLSMQRWMKSFVRDVLDESDEILHVKYQLVYTVGGQQSLDGGAERWKLIQFVLSLIKKHATHIHQEFPEDVSYEPVSKRSQFSQLRLLSDRPYQRLCQIIADQWLEQRHFRSDDKRLIRSFVLNTDTSVATLNHRFPSDAVQLFLVMRGLLSAEVLLVALKKRHRVNYGVNPNPAFHRLMAVPYRAKDVAADRTEFGHIDVALVLTQLSYYYSGLKDQQLLECIKSLLENETDPQTIYEEWLSHEYLDTVPASIKQWKSVNLRDCQQRRGVLYPTLKHNVSVIDYFLNHFVYPQEAKQFLHKLVASSWDLTTPIRSHIITGFSGTNDTQLLLPVHIRQCDLAELRQTDAIVLNNILRPENEHYRVLPSNASSETILKLLNSDAAVRVILDVGALLIDRSNLDIAVMWLGMSKKEEVDYAVYFESDQLFVCDRQQRHHPFLISPANERLDRCVIYLDEIHTRGTDLKFPPGFKAALTLGTGLTKDRFVQAAMRMRRLGHGHSLSFCSSEEVHQQMLGLRWHSSEQMTLLDILHWVYTNTQCQTWDGFHHWATQSLSYQRKVHAFRSIQWNNPEQQWTSSMMKALGTDCLECEVIELKHMYGSFREMQTIRNIYQARYECCQERYSVGIHKQVCERLDRYSGSKTRLAQLLDEEQEKELEQELEEERQCQPPPPVTPAEPMWHKIILNLCDQQHSTVDLTRHPDVFLRFRHAFNNTTFFNDWPPDTQDQHIWVTTEFQRVIETQSESLDPFLRPPRWILVYHNTHLILLSPFEANRIMDHLHYLHHRRASDCPVKTSLRLLLPRIRQYQSILINTPTLTTMPPSIHTSFDIPLSILAELFLFNGTLYFTDHDEESSYCKHLGLCPAPRTRADQAAFDQGHIDIEGFVTDQNYRRRRMPQCRFTSNPLHLVKKLLENRHQDHPSMISHVGSIVFKGKKSQNVQATNSAYRSNAFDSRL